MNIRLAQETDLDSIQKIIKTSFSDEENKVITNIVAELAKETAIHPIKSLIAEVDNQVIGYVSYSPIFLRPDANISGYILAPLAVSPEHQKQGVGTSLIKSGIDLLVKDGVNVLLVYGYPDYYRRFGFQKKIASSFMPPYPLEYPFGWLGVMLNKTAIPNIIIKFECVAALSKPDIW